jgi:hypothetical protein
MNTIPDAEKRRKLKSTLIIVTLLTIPCYLLGLLIVWVGSAVKNRSTITPTTFNMITDTPPFETPTLPQPSAVFDTFTPTLTPTLGPSRTPSATYFIPSSTPTSTFTPTHTSTVTPTYTNTPTETATLEPSVAP